MVCLVRSGGSYSFGNGLLAFPALQQKSCVVVCALLQQHVHALAVMNAGTPSAKAASVIRTLEPVVANMTDLGLLSKSYIYGFDEMKIQYNKSVCKASDHPLARSQMR